MNSKYLFAFLVTLTLFVTGLYSCKKTDCNSVICNPCPGNRFVIAYRDSSGNCDSIVKVNTRIEAFLKDSSWTGTPEFSYSLTDSCNAALIFDSAFKYRIKCTSPAFMDTIHLSTITYQDPVEVTECCQCYPANVITLSVNGVSQNLTFPAGQYENTPWPRIIP